MKLEFEGKEVLIPLFGIPTMTVLIMAAAVALLLVVLGTAQKPSTRSVIGVETNDVKANVRLNITAGEAHVPVSIIPKAETVSIPIRIDAPKIQGVTVPVTVIAKAPDTPVATTIDIIPTIRRSRLPLDIDPTWMAPPNDGERSKKKEPKK